MVPSAIPDCKHTRGNCGHATAALACAYLHLGAPSRIGCGLSTKMSCTKPTSTKVDSDGPNPDLRKVQPRRLGGSHS